MGKLVRFQHSAATVSRPLSWTSPTANHFVFPEQDILLLIFEGPQILLIAGFFLLLIVSMDTFDTSEEVMSEIDIQEIEVDFGQNFEYGTNNQEHENNNEQETGIDGEKGEIKENPEYQHPEERNEDKIDPMLQHVIDCRGGEEKDWKFTDEYAMRFDGKDLYLLDGINLTELVRAYEARESTTIEVQAHYGMIESLKNNPTELFKPLDQEKETEEGKITTTAVIKMDNERNIICKTWTREEKKEREVIEEKPINKTEPKAEETTLNLELSIDIDKQEEVDKETILGQSLLTETLEMQIENKQGIEQAIEVVENESNSNILESKINLTNVEKTIEKEETNIQSDIAIPQEKSINTENIHNSEQLIIETKINSTEQVVVPEEEIVNVLDNVQKIEQNQEEKINPVVNKGEQKETNSIAESQEKIVDEKTVLNIEQPTVKTEERIERVMTLEDRIRELLRNDDEPIFTEITEIETETLSVPSEQTESVIVTEEIKDFENISEKVEIPAVVTKTTIRETLQENRTKEAIKEIREAPETINVVSNKHTTENKAREKNPERIIAEQKEAEETTVRAVESEKIQVSNLKTEKEVKDSVITLKTTESKVNLKNIEVKTTKPIVEKTNITKEINKLPNTDKEKTVAKNEQDKKSKNSREAIVLNINRNTINNTTRNETSISLKKPREEKQNTEESLKAKPFDGHKILLQILGISQNTTELRNAEPTNSRSIPSINQEEQETKSTKSIPDIYQQRSLNGITLKIAT